MLYRQQLKRLIWVGLIVLILAYSAYQTRNLIRGPIIVVEQPLDGSVFQQPEITLAGQTKNIAKLYLNDRKIFTDEQGHFQESLLIADGYSILKLQATDRFGRTINKTIRVSLIATSSSQISY